MNGNRRRERKESRKAAVGSGMARGGGSRGVRRMGKRVGGGDVRLLPNQARARSGIKVTQQHIQRRSGIQIIQYLLA